MKNPTKSYCSHCERVTNQDTVHDTVDAHTPADTPENAPTHVRRIYNETVDAFSGRM